MAERMNEGEYYEVIGVCKTGHCGEGEWEVINQYFL